jgi:hypothetical protein
MDCTRLQWTPVDFAKIWSPWSPWISWSPGVCRFPLVFGFISNHKDFFAFDLIEKFDTLIHIGEDFDGINNTSKLSE